MTTSPVYDTIGQGYVAHRRADPRWEAVIFERIGPADLIVNVGAGTGSYEPPGRSVLAVDPSSVMIGQRPAGAAPAVRASGAALPLASGCADVTMAILTVHHWDDWAGGLAEMCRVAPRQLVLGIDFDLHASFWLLAGLPARGGRRHPKPRTGRHRDREGHRGHDDGAARGAGRHGRRRARGLLAPARGLPGPGRAGELLGTGPGRSGRGRPRRRCAGGRPRKRGVEERHADLLSRDSLDLGYRLVVSE